MKKHLLLLLLFGIIITNVISQPVIEKQKTVGGTLSDEFRCLYLTKDGGIIAGGYSSSNRSNEKTENSKGGIDYWIVKFDRNGKIEWDKTIGGSGDDALISVIQTTDEGYILGGTSTSSVSGDKTENSKGGVDYWIVKTDKLGNVEWDKTIGTNALDLYSTITQTSDGGYIAGGSTDAGISGDKTEINRGGENDYWIVKLSSSGSIEWDKTIGGSGDDNLSSVRQTADGYILAGWSESRASGEKSADRHGSDYDYWVVKLDNARNVTWDKTIGGNNFEHIDCDCLQQTGDGGLLLSGTSESYKSFEKSEDSKAGSFDYWIVRLNSSGIILWDKTIGSDGNESLRAVDQTRDGGFILGGSSDGGISGNKTEGARGMGDYWVVKINEASAVMWDKTIGGQYSDILYSVKETGKNRYLLGGSSLSDISGDKTQKNRGSGDDFWFVLLRSNAAARDSSTNNITSSSLLAGNTFRVYPNPVKGILHIQTKGKAIIILTNQQGKTILTKTINGKSEINVSHLPAGLYYVKNNETSEVQKIIITK
jgi:hypothetical protein